jgi:hypothetical protein
MNLQAVRGWHRNAMVGQVGCIEMIIGIWVSNRSFWADCPIQPCPLKKACNRRLLFQSGRRQWGLLQKSFAQLRVSRKLGLLQKILCEHEA